jgi:hypothetical protein
MYVCMYVEGVGQKSGPCTATFNDLFFEVWCSINYAEGQMRLIIIITIITITYYTTTSLVAVYLTKLFRLSKIYRAE